MDRSNLNLCRRCGLARQRRMWGCLLSVLMTLPVAASARPAARRVAADTAASTFVYRFELPRTVTEGAQTRIEQSGAQMIPTPGHPRLPYHIATLPVPDGRRVAGVDISAGTLTSLSLEHPVAPAQAPFPLSRGPGDTTPPDKAIYGRARLYPAALHRPPARWRKHHQDFLSIPLFPVRWSPHDNRLLAATNLTITVRWRDASPGSARRRDSRRQADVDDVQRLSDVPLLPLSDAESGDLATGPFQTFNIGSPYQLTPGDFEHIIISPEALLAYRGPNSFHDLSAARRAQGMTSTNVSLEWIEAHYDGTRPDGGSDTPTRIRNFVRDAYTQWGTRFLLLGGDAATVPVRHFYVPLLISGEDYTTEMPADLYYGCLDGSFDGSANGRYGERYDGTDLGEVDLVAEVYVGRLPIATTNELSYAVGKTLTYEQQPAEQLRRIIHVGEYLGFGGISDYAKPQMEQLRLGGTYDGYTTTGFENSIYQGDFVTTQTLYQADGYWNDPEIYALMNGDSHLFNHLGHGAPHNAFQTTTQLMRLNLTNDMPFFVYSQACELGRFDDFSDCVAETLTTHPHGAFATIMNVRFGWGMSYSTDGPSHKFHRRFWDVVLRQGVPYIGKANQLSKEPLIGGLNAFENRPLRWCYYEITCFGDPATAFARPIWKAEPKIEHTGLTNQYDTNAVHRIEADITPSAPLDTNRLVLAWQTGSTTAPTNTRTLSMTGAHHYTAEIPAQPMGTPIWYSISASTLRGTTTVWPDGPGSAHRFDMTPVRELQVDGDPLQPGSVTPAYGITSLASGVVVNAIAPLRSPASAGVRQRCIGWRGEHSVPASGISTNCVFVLHADSRLTWLWTNEYALAQHSLPTGILAETNWWTHGEAAVTLSAPLSATDGSKSYVFCGWYIDGVRQPETGLPDDVATGLAMLTPRSAEALYLPEFRDDDGDGIADWWEYRYYAGPIDPGLDSDDDSATALDEFLDRTDPFDSSSSPAAPWIDHTPLVSPHPVPAPFTVVAAITDSFEVAQANLQWKLNESPWQSTQLVVTAGSAYQAVIPAPAVLGDQILYLISATDLAGHSRLHGPHSVHIAYPLVDAAPLGTNTLILPPGGADSDLITISNAGNASLNWALMPGVFDDIEGEGESWVSDRLQPWTVATNRAYSPGHCWYSVLETPGGTTGLAARATLDLPELRLGPSAQLTFRAWMETEQDSDQPGFVFDGGIIEISTNGGADFAQLPGPYTYQIHGWSADKSPWPDGTPCLSGTGAGWDFYRFDLSAYAGRDVIVRFHHGGDNNINHEGWYLDDIGLEPVDRAWPPALMPVAKAGELAPGAQTSVVVNCSAELGTRNTVTYPVCVAGNDPIHPVTLSFWLLAVHHPPQLSNLSAYQSSTHGEGLVTIAVDLADAEGMPCAVTTHFSTDAGFTWQQPVLNSATSTLGHVLLTSGSAPEVQAIATQDDGRPATNRLTFTWDTRAVPGISTLSPYTLLRLQAADQDFNGMPIPCAPFMVDNQPPLMPSLSVLSHVPGVWSSNRMVQAEWVPVSDGGGAGLAGYGFVVTNGAPPDPTAASVLRTHSSALSGPLSDASDWRIGLFAADVMGNRSPVRVVSPLQVDSTPPDAGAAAILPVLSEAGPYVIGSSIAAAWSGFTDPHSGIEGYYFSLTNGSGRPGPVLFAAPDGAVAGIANVTNRVFVWARDHAGNIGAAVSADVLLLSPGNDPDNDGMISGDEEVAGTDATRTDDVLRLDLAPVPSSPGVLDVFWPSVDRRRYTLYATSSLTTGIWHAVSGAEALPGTGHSITSTVSATPAAFLRVGVSKP